MMRLFSPAKGRRLAFAVRSLTLLCGIAGIATPILKPASAVAQNPAAARTIDGKVVDKDNAPIKGAVVYLKDGHTLSVKSYISTEDGSYRFGQLATNTDYSLWAESGGKKSATKNISSFDSKKDFTFSLKIEK